MVMIGVFLALGEGFVFETNAQLGSTYFFDPEEPLFLESEVDDGYDYLYSHLRYIRETKTSRFSVKLYGVQKSYFYSKAWNNKSFGLASYLRKSFGKDYIKGGLSISHRYYTLTNYKETFLVPFLEYKKKFSRGYFNLKARSTERIAIETPKNYSQPSLSLSYRNDVWEDGEKKVELNLKGESLFRLYHQPDSLRRTSLKYRIGITIRLEYGKVR